MVIIILFMSFLDLIQSYKKLQWSKHIYVLIYNFYKCKKNMEINYSGKNDIYKKELYIYLIYNK